MKSKPTNRQRVVAADELYDHLRNRDRELKEAIKFLQAKQQRNALDLLRLAMEHPSIRKAHSGK